MARRGRLSTQGRILAAGLSVAVGGALVGVMAAGDHGDASATTSTPSSGATDRGGPVAIPSGGASTDSGASSGGFGDPGSTGSFSPQPQTRTGGS
jgi:hypothetical protein